MDVRHEDVLIAAVLILVDLEAEADGHQFVPGEAAGGRVAQHRARHTGRRIFSPVFASSVSKSSSKAIFMSPVVVIFSSWLLRLLFWCYFKRVIDQHLQR